MTHRGALLGVLLLAVAARAQPVVTVHNRHIILRDDSVPPIDLYHRYFKIRIGTRLAEDTHRVVPPPAGSAGDPTSAGASGGGATLQVYNANGSGELVEIALPAANWYRNPNDPLRFYEYIGTPATTLPVRKIYVRPDKLFIRAQGPLWPYTLDEPTQGRMAVRLTLGTGVTYCAEGPARIPVERNDRIDTFIGADTDAPAVCPPLP